MTSLEIWMLVGMAVAAVLHVFSYRVSGFGIRGPKKREKRFIGGFEISPSGHGHEWARVYEEPREPEIVFEGGPRGLLIVPSARRWQLDVPEWAKHKRGEILARLAAQKWHVGFMEYDDDATRDRLIYLRRNPGAENPVI